MHSAFDLCCSVAGRYSSPAPTATEVAGLEAGRRAQPSVAHRLISGILLALPFAQLHEIVDLLQWEGMITANQVREVLQEREQRRIQALREYINKQANKIARDYYAYLSYCIHDCFITPPIAPLITSSIALSIASSIDLG